MYRKCYALLTAPRHRNVAERTPFAEKWRPICHVGSNLTLMVRHTIRAITYSPLYIHSFRLVQPHTLVEAEKFNLRYTDPSQIDNTPDKLRWYRYQKGLLQRDVAEYARRLGVPIENLKQWETDRVQIFKSTWQQIMLRG